MTVNPFELLKNVQSMKDSFSQVQDQLGAVTAEGSAGGGIVKVTVNGRMQLIQINIDPIAVDPRDVAMLQDLILSAHNQAFSNIQEKIKSSLGPMIENLPFKL